jgi:hypothetical protein
MTIEEQIQALLDKAAPLRLLPDDEAEAAGLPKIVDSINALRAVQTSAVEIAAPVAPVAAPAEPMKRGPGRPKKDEAA